MANDTHSGSGLSGSRMVEQRLQLNVVYACDGQYAMQLATAMRSLADSNVSSWPIKVFALASDVDRDVQLAVEESLPSGAIELVWSPVVLDAFKAYTTLPHVSQATYARLLMPVLLPPEIRRVLYLDSDTLVLGSLADLWSVELDGMAVGAVPDALIADPRLGLMSNERWTTALPSHLDSAYGVKNYFNAGVLLADLNEWRSRQITQRAIEFLERNPQSPFSDQDALNVACAGSWKVLDRQWNFQQHLALALDGVPEEQRPTIVHFVAGAKPWLPSVRHPCAALYDAIRTKTRFARSRTDRVVGWSRWWASGIRNGVRRLLSRGLKGVGPPRRSASTMP